MATKRLCHAALLRSHLRVLGNLIPAVKECPSWALATDPEFDSNAYEKGQVHYSQRCMAVEILGYDHQDVVAGVDDADGNMPPLPFWFNAGTMYLPTEDTVDCNKKVHARVISKLFSWMTGKNITPQQVEHALSYRHGGRWTVNFIYLEHDLGVSCKGWTLPLTQDRSNSPPPPELEPQDTDISDAADEVLKEVITKILPYTSPEMKEWIRQQVA